jgi:hypothetical protein
VVVKFGLALLGDPYQPVSLLPHHKTQGEPKSLNVRVDCEVIRVRRMLYLLLRNGSDLIPRILCLPIRSNVRSLPLLNK